MMGLKKVFARRYTSFRFQLIAVIAVGLVCEASLVPRVSAGVNRAATVAQSATGAVLSSGTNPPPATDASPPSAIGHQSSIRDSVPILWVPRAANFVDASGSVGAESLFDGDGATGFRTEAGRTTSLRLDLGATRELMGLGVHGTGHAKIAVYVEERGARRLVSSVPGDGTLRLDAAHWDQVVSAVSTPARALIVELTAPSTAPVTLTELALWVAGRSRDLLSEAPLADQLVAKAVPENAVSAGAVPWTASVARVTPQGSVSATFIVAMKLEPLLGRAFLTYEVDKKAHWTGVARSINGHVVRGGYRADATGLGGVQVEEINARWLRRGDNTIKFQPTLLEDGHGYSIHDVRVVLVPNGSAPAPGATSRSPLADRDLSTGIGGAGTHSATLPAPTDRDLAFLSFYLDQPTGGTLTGSATGARAGNKGQVRIDLTGRPAGWQSVPIAGALPATSELKVRVAGDRESTGHVSEARLHPFPALAAPTDLTVSYPLHGECQDQKTYVRGFVTGTTVAGKSQLYVDGQQVVGKIDADGSFEADVSEPAGVQGKPWSVRLDVTTADGGHRTRTVPVDTCVEPAKHRILGVSPPVEDVGAPYGAVVSPQKASKLSFAGATIEIPAGAVGEDVRVTMRALDRGQLPPLEAELENVTAGGMALRFGPHGLKFKKPIKVTLPVEAERVSPGMNSGDVVALFFDEASSKWTQLPKVVGRPDRTVAETTHFTDFIAATIRTPDHPDAQQFNPNTMKNVKVGEPGAGISVIAPPDANSTGSARLSYPIETPRGRNGIEPHLALSYDSDRTNSNGWLGIGWDLRLSSIEIDTRFGVPKYDGSELYALDGAMLAATATAGTYVRRVESSFDLIQRQGTGPTNYSWKVTDKSGTIYTYGTVASSRLANVRPGQPGNIFRWYLERVQDTYGNFMTITYQHDTYGAGDTFDGVYLSAIDYTANGALAANYHVTFTVDAAGTRPDTTSSGRPGFLEATRRRLTDVIVKSGSTLVRQYHLAYQTNLTDTMQKSVLQAVALWGVQGDQTSELYRHTFEYQKAPASTAMFQDQQTWGQFSQLAPNPADGFVTRTANGLTHTNDGMSGGNVTLGVGFPVVSATGSFGTDSGSSAPDLSFFGLTGEGVPDQIDSQGTLSVNRLVGSQIAQNHFLASGVTGLPLPLLGNTGRSGFTAGGNVGALNGLFGGGVSYARHLSNESSLIADINGDGFPDLLSENGNVVSAYVNDGKQKFTPYQWTGYSLADSPFSTANRLTDPTVAQASFATDPLIRWVAPFDGTVTISANAQSGTAYARAEVYVANDAVRTLTLQPANGNGNPQYILNGYVRAIHAGDKLYLRLVDLSGNPASAFTQMGATIVYAPPSGRNVNEVDANGDPIFVYNIDRNQPGSVDFVSVGQPRLPWHLTGNGDVIVSRCFTAPGLDDVNVSYVFRDKSGNVVPRSPALDLTVPAGTTACFSPSVLPTSPTDSAAGVFYNVIQDQSLELEISSDSPLDSYNDGFAPSEPSMKYIRYCRLSVCGNPQPSGIEDSSSTYTISGDPFGASFPIPGTDIVRDSPVAFRQMRFWRTFSGGNASSPQPIKSIPAPAAMVTIGGSVRTTAALTEDVLLLVQGVRQLYGKLKIPKGTPANTTISFPGVTRAATPGDPLFFTAYSPTIIGANVTWSPTLNGTSMSPAQLASINYSIRDAAIDNNPPIGDNSRDPMSGGYHHWFYGDWNDSVPFCDNQAGCANPIVRTTASPQTSDAVMGDLPTNLTGQNSLWLGRGGSQMWSEGNSPLMTPGRVNSPNATASSGASSSALRISDTWNINSVVTAAGVNAGANGGDATTQVDFFDFNGDRFPDSITRSGVQYNDGATGFAPRQAVDMAIGGSTELRRVLNASLQAGVAVSANGRQIFNESEGGGDTKKLGSTAALSASADYGVSSTRIDFVDVNGDGLVDHVRQEPADGRLRVKLNMGYGFSNEVFWGTFSASDWSWSQQNTSVVLNWKKLSDYVPVNQIVNVLNLVPNTPTSTNVVRLQDTGTLGTTLGADFGVIGGGGGPTYSVTRTWVDMLDVNGDGLPDQVMKVPNDGHLRVKLNTGNGFTSEQQWSFPAWTASTGSNYSFMVPDGLGFSSIDGWSKNLSFQICFFVCFGASGFESDSKGGPSSQFEDIDGDGKLDQVMKVPGDANVYAKLNNIGQTNLLTAVNRPLGGRIELSYARVGNHVDLSDSQVKRLMPANQWAMSGVTVHSAAGANLDATIVENFKYTDPSGFGSGYHDPVERENLGYASVQTKFPNEDQGTSVDRTYLNWNYYLRGLEDTVATYQNEAAGVLLRTSRNQYADPSLKDPQQQPARTGTIFPALRGHDTFFWEGGGAPIGSSRMTTYDTSGNLTDVVETGGDASLNYHIDYNHPAPNITLPYTITARDGFQPGTGALVAKRTVTYFTQGKPNTVTDLIVNGKDPTTGVVRTESAPANATWTLTYDVYGNVQTSTSPGLSANPSCPTCGHKVQYTYDTTTQTYPVTTAQVDADPNAQYSASAVYDVRFGLPTRILDVAGARQEIDYDNYGRVTKVFAPTDFDASGNRLDTNAPTIAVTYSEGPHTAGAAETVPAWSMATHRSAIPGEGALPGAALPTALLHTVNFVDGLLRSVQVKRDMTRDDGNGNLLAGMSVSGPTTFDARGRVYQQGQPTFAAGTGSTAFVIVPMTYPTQYAYDVFGRMRQETHTDNGTQAITTISYQQGVSPLTHSASLVKITSDPLFAANSAFHYKTEYRNTKDELQVLAEPTQINGATTTVYTTYRHDSFSRVVSVTDAKVPVGNVTTAEYDTVGNTVAVTSPDSGRREWRYCVGGYVCTEESPNERAAGRLTKYAYDRDRLKTITYPNDVAATYVYGNASEKGAAGGYHANRVKQRTDEAGQFTYAYDALGNVASETAVLKNQMVAGTNYQSYQTQYKWDNFGRLIDVSIPGTTALGTPSETIRYGYDAGGEVTSAWGVAGTTNYPYVRHVGYNEFGQRVRITYGNQAVGTYGYAPDTRRLTAAGTAIQDISGQAARPAQALTYSYDLVGNVSARSQILPLDSVTTDVVPVGGNNTDSYYYDPLNQLTHADQYSQSKQSDAYYASVDIAYDEIGNIKTKAQIDTKYSYDLGGNTTGTTRPSLDNYVFTPSYSGSSYNASPHAASSISENHLGTVSTRTLAYDADGNLTQAVYGSIGRGIAWTDTDRVRSICNGTPGGTCPVIAQALYTADGTRTHNKVSQGTPSETLYVNQYLTVRNGMLPTKHVYLGDARVASKVEGSGAAKSYWYHSDNIQSAEYVTTTGQALVQHLEYFPAGEIWREENSPALVPQIAHATTFTGKEMDPTGYYYFGARYYEPQIQMWLSPDPILKELFSAKPSGGVLNPRNLGLYAFSWNNPVVLRDSDGRFPVIGDGTIPGLATHQEITRTALKSFVSNDALAAITRGNVAVDSHQKNSEQYMHSMRSTDESSGQAKAESAKFVEEHLNNAAELIKSGEFEKGWEQFGAASHTVQDGDATAHSSAGEPTTFEPGNRARHLKTDMSERMDQAPAQGAVADTRNLFGRLEKAVKSGAGDRGWWQWEKAVMGGRH